LEKTPNFKAELVGVFGHPVSENPTIMMIEAAFKELGINWRYLTIEVLPEDLEDAVKGLRAFNMRGINLTIPHKIEVMKYLDRIASDAELIGAVNTVVCKDGVLTGENTDGKGFLHSLRLDAGTDPSGLKVVVLGAGGAARAISVELALSGVKHITIVNRTEEKGRKLSALLKNKIPTDSSFVLWKGDYDIPDDTDIVVNATSIGLFPDVESKPNIKYDTITDRMIVCDVIPNPPFTLFLKEAQQRGANILDGLGMLVYQGMIGFRLWTGLDAPVEVMKEALKKALGIDQ
jgi:shikimate dehydrogenase